jgi:CheY-like chemotaxis protein
MSDEAIPSPIALKPNYDRTSYILVVDDDNTLLKFFKIHLNKFFSRVLVVKNAKEAVQALGEKEVDLVLSDIRMPRVDGLQLMRKVRRQDPSIPFLLISGALLSEDQQQKSDQADGYLRKPFSVDELHAFIEHGIALRDKYKRLCELLADPKDIRKVLQGRLKVERALADTLHLTEAGSILADIKKAG